MLTKHCLCLLLALLLSLTSVGAQNELTGEIEGAFYQINSPQESNGKLVLLAHGYRLEARTKTADYGSGNVLSKTLLESE